MFSLFRDAFKVSDLRKKVFFIAAMLVIFRAAANIPLPGVDVVQLRFFLEGNQLLGFLNLFSGGGLTNISIVLLGVGPYITASIIMQLLTMIVPRVEQMYREEGEAGRQKFTMITRFLSVPLAMAQTFGMVVFLGSQGILPAASPTERIELMVIATAGSVFLMWLGELITEKGLGNGVSFLIFAGIAAGIPSALGQLSATFDATQFFTYLAFVAIGVVTIMGVVFVSEGQRLVTIHYAKRYANREAAQSARTHLPLRVTQAGVVPIIFALSLLSLPMMLAQFAVNVDQGMVQNIARSVEQFFQNTFWYGVIYFFLVVGFTYFYTAIVFDPKKIAENLQKQGGFIPGIRPGRSTEQYLGEIILRITLAGSLFLGAIAVLPLIVQGMTGIAAVAVGGTSVLIVVSVVIEILKHLEGQLAMREYDGFVHARRMF